LHILQYLQLDYTLGPEVTTNPYHINVVRSTMTRNVAAQFEDMHSEAVSAFEDLVSSNSLGKPGLNIIAIEFYSHA
jgi:hypothetical protein